MLEVDVDHLDAQLPVLLEELLTGGGAVAIRQAFTPDDIDEARRLIVHYSSTDEEKITHFHGAHEDQVHLQRGCGTSSTRARSSSGWCSTRW